MPFDRRVWLECRTLTEAGYRVAVVCPRGHGDPGFAVLEGVELYKYRPYARRQQGLVRYGVPLLLYRHPLAGHESSQEGTLHSGPEL